MVDDECSACAWCGKSTPDLHLSHTPHGLCCPACVRTAQAEQMRANDMQGRAPDSQGTQLHQLVERLREACQVTTPPTDAGYPLACVNAAGSLELSVSAVDVAELVYAARQDGSRDDFEAQCGKTIDDLVWLLRWQTHELKHAARQLNKAREALTHASMRRMVTTINGGDA